MNPSKSKLFGIAWGVCAIALPSPAIAQTQSFVDLTGDVGYSRNPFLAHGGNGSAFGRVSAFGLHSIRGERGSTDLSGYVENTTYLSDYGSKQIFVLDASTRYKVSELVEMFGDASFSGDRGGQLIGRFDTSPSAPPDTGPGPPPLPDELLDPNALNLDRRQYRLAGQVGAILTVSERDTVTVAGLGQHVFYSKDGDELNYTVVTGTGEWQRQFSERTSGGAQMSVQRANYPGPDHNSTVYTPQLTLQTLLGNGWDADVAAGLSLIRRRTETDDDRSINPSVDAAICRNTEAERFCGRGSYSTQTATTQDALQTTALGVDYFNRLNLKDTVQARVGFTHYSGGNSGSEVSKTTYYTGGLSYSRRFSDRLSAGADAGARKIVEKADGSVPLDVSLSAFVRYRLGDIL